MEYSVYIKSHFKMSTVLSRTGRYLKINRNQPDVVTSFDTFVLYIATFLNQIW